ncbi:hypothetical protein BDA96_08G143500 [Sorghum bicolor]|uniref:Uncharacterized protein n=2 Tax=Sorghum bicolor TaxID=4558 RepID=A0A921U8B8_SORBI|nr:uncharacterized protein LOC8068845 isoform X1 [Sorghum bicolor]EES17203.1 hypothetical protein SORBI_3008G130700 [Sorghum bicolor]KAG0521230.1 hypothetical protein BDA96_08G143500 [Sorghum bicolor]|eukprot:XP_002443365.1 uncharacterized protein LOC8068845 isoform X1 [Sorghum bicolor]
MMFRRSGKSCSKAKKKKGTAAPWQNGVEPRKVDGGGPGSNSRQVAPDTTGMGNIDDGTSRDETFFEATPWFESDCEDDFYSVNGDLTPARSFTSRTSRTTVPGPQNLPTLGAILKAEPLKPPAPPRKLGDLLRETQDDDDIAMEGPDDLSKDDSLRILQEANRCCVPQLARAISCNGRRQHK